MLAVTAAYLAWEEVSEFHADGTRALGETLLGAAYRSNLWPVVLSPLIVAFVLAMAVFVSKGPAFDRFDRLTAGKLRTGGPRHC